MHFVWKSRKNVYQSHYTNFKTYMYLLKKNIGAIFFIVNDLELTYSINGKIPTSYLHVYFLGID